MTSYVRPPGSDAPPPPNNQPAGTMPPPPGAPPPGAPPPGRPGRPNRPGRQPRQQGYQQFTQNAQNIQATPTQYEQDVLGGQYLDVKNNPYVQGYTNALSRDFQRNLQAGLSEVSSPFMSGATLGQTGIHADVRGRYFSEGMQDLGDTLSKSYFDTYNQERGRQNEVSGQLSGRTNQLVSGAASAYGADQQARAQIQSSRIAAQSALRQAQMAQQLGYDELASRNILEYERLNMEAARMEQQYILSYAGLAGQTGRDFAGTTQETQGPGMSSTQGIAQGVIGGAMSGFGAGSYFGGSTNPGLNNSPAGRYFAGGPW